MDQARIRQRRVARRVRPFHFDGAESYPRYRSLKRESVAAAATMPGARHTGCVYAKEGIGLSVSFTHAPRRNSTSRLVRMRNG